MRINPKRSSIARIVVLCADEAAQDALAYWLNSSGIGASIARSGYEAKALLDMAGARMLVTDRALPPWPGLDTISGLKHALAGLRVAVLDDGVPENAALARASGADVILTWPLRRANVIDACRAYGSSSEELPCAS